MDVRNCSRCGKIYHYDGFRICQTCRKGDEVDFQKVKDYLYEHPGASIPEVEEATEVESRKIIEFLRAGRLEVGEDSNLVLECESCGTAIRTGRFCSSCTSNLHRELGQAVAKPKQEEVKLKEKEKERFRVVDRYK